MFKLVFEKMESILSHDDLAYKIKNLTLKNAKQNKLFGRKPKLQIVGNKAKR